MARKQSKKGAAVKRSAQRDDPEQSKRFLEAAREHQAATTEEEARKAFRKVVDVTKKRKD